METAAMIILGVALLASLALNAFIIQKSIEEKKDLHNRLMSREYPEYLHGEHTLQLLKDEEEKAKNKPKETERLSREFLDHKKKAEMF